MLKVKLLDPRAKIPVKGRFGDGAYDLFALERVLLYPESAALVPLGIATAFDPGLVALIFDRSGLGVRGVIHRAGVIDSNFRGEWRVCLYNQSDELIEIPYGKACAQVVLVPCINEPWKEVNQLEESVRGVDWLGSSDCKEMSGDFQSKRHDSETRSGGLI